MMIKLRRERKLIYWTMAGVFIIILLFVIFIAELPKEREKPEEGKKSFEIPETQFDEAIRKDESACDEITDEGYRDLCHYSFALKEAVRDREINLCNSLSMDFIKTCQNNYYFQVAQEEEDLSLCSQITHSNLEKQCQEDVGRLIEESAEEEKTSGFILLKCEEVEDSKTKQVCQNLFSLEEIFDEEDCNDFQDIASKKICLEILRKRSQIELENLSIKEAEQIVCKAINEPDIQSICFDFFEYLKR